jgi:Apocytochrome F, C-terminal
LLERSTATGKVIGFQPNQEKGGPAVTIQKSSGEQVVHQGLAGPELLVNKGQTVQADQPRG